jgi:hypothetical protein
MSTQTILPQDQRTVVVDIDIPFTRLVAFFIKAALASIPAAIIVWIIVMLLMGLFGMMFGFGWMMQRTI